MSTPRLYIRAPDEGTRIEVLDPKLQPIALPHNAGEAKLDVVPGLYVVRFRRGLAITEKLAYVGRDDEEVSVTLEENEEPIFATAAPVRQAGEQPSPQQIAAERLSREAPQIIGEASEKSGHLLLFFRCDGSSQGRLDSRVTLHQENGLELIRVESLAEANSDAGWAGLHLSLPSGAYRLRRMLGESSVEQMLHVRPKWQTQLFAKVLPQEQGAAVDFTLLSVLMAQTTSGFDGSRPEGRHAESALRALRERSSISGPMSQYMLDGKFENPLLGVLAALLQLRRTDLDASSLKPVVDNLYWIMGAVPDVLALGLALMTREPALRDDELMRTRFCAPAILSVPPYFSDSWRHIIDASQWDPKLIPVQSLSARAATTLARTMPWFRWRMTLDPPAPVPSKIAVSLWTAAKNVLSAFGITPERVADFTAATLNRILKSIQDSLARFDDVAELLESATFDDVDRRIAGFVYPLTDAALAALLEGLKDRGQALRESVLARGQDSRELARVLQLPLGTAILKAISLSASLGACLKEVEPDERIRKFLERESHGNENLQGALQSLRSMTTSVRHIGMSRAVDSLEYLVLRYEPISTAKAMRLPLVDAETSQPVDPKLDRQILRNARKTLIQEISRLSTSGQISADSSTSMKVVATLRDYKPGELFPTMRWSQIQPVRKTNLRLIVSGLTRLEVRDLAAKLGAEFQSIAKPLSAGAFGEAAATATASVLVSAQAIDALATILTRARDNFGLPLKIQRASEDAEPAREVSDTSFPSGTPKQEVIQVLRDKLALDLSEPGAAGPKRQKEL